MTILLCSHLWDLQELPTCPRYWRSLPGQSNFQSLAFSNKTLVRFSPRIKPMIPKNIKGMLDIYTLLSNTMFVKVKQADAQLIMYVKIYKNSFCEWKYIGGNFLTMSKRWRVWRWGNYEHIEGKRTGRHREDTSKEGMTLKLRVT